MVAYLTAAGGNPSALATALIALGGAIFGALASTGTQLLIERARARRERREHDDEVRTAARMMISDLRRAKYNLTDSRHQRDTDKWHAGLDLRLRISDEDRRLVIGALDPQGLNKVDRAEQGIDTWYSLRDRYSATNREGTMEGVPLAIQAGRTVGQVVPLIDAAIAELTVLGGVVSSLEPTGS
jgi:hypothetical protein